MVAQENPATQQLLDDIYQTSINDSIEKSVDFWKAQAKLLKYAQNPIALAKIDYYIARNFAPIDLDSAEFYVVRATETLEKHKGFENEKALVYNGLGNIANARGKIYLSAYYYNKITAMIDANPDVDIQDKIKAAYYLHSSQANWSTGKKERGYQQNLKALTFAKNINDDEYVKFRIYSQLFSSGLIKEEDTTLKSYLENVGRLANTQETKRYYHEHKAQWYEYKGKYDSAQIYLKKSLAYDTIQPESNRILNNIFVTYSNLLINAVKLGDISKAKKYISAINQIKNKHENENFDQSKELVFLDGLKEYYQLISDFENYKKTTEQIISLNNEIHEKSEIRAVQEMSSMYQLKAKEKSIKQLSTTMEEKDTQLQLTKTLLMAMVIAALLATIGFLYFNFKRKNKQLQQQADTVILQQKLLRTQMEPHFIFNTLSTLQSLIRLDKKEMSIKYLSQFSRLLRNSLEMSRKDWVILQEELDTLQSYMHLQQLRFENLFQYQIETDEALDSSSIMIPPMLIQPFVENSILHGFKGQKNGGKLHIHIKELNDKILQVSIKDNGKGFDKNDIPHQDQSFSGTIAKERLEILAKKNKSVAQYTIESEKTKGTKVVLELPMREKF